MARKILGLIISGLILLVLYIKLGVSPLNSLRNADIWDFAIAISLFIPITLLTARRFYKMAGLQIELTLGESLRLLLAASTLNLILPSKAGDLAKGFFISTEKPFDRSHAHAIVIIEKTVDLFSLVVWGTIGVAFSAGPIHVAIKTLILLLLCSLFFFFLLPGLPDFRQSLHAAIWLKERRFAQKIVSILGAIRFVLAQLYSNRRLTVDVAASAILIWFLHLIQIFFFARSLGASMTFLENCSYGPLSLLAGLLPFTFAGVGVRDATVIYYYGAHFRNGSAGAAALGLLLTARYLLPATLGIPFLTRYLTQWRKNSRTNH